MKPLGRLSQVSLRDIWKSEASEFTPWLAREDNLALLGEAIGLDLELESTEMDVGPFKADILCKETATDRRVLIENQLERTDHNHLGQILTYAAGLDAVSIVWIAERFTEEHRAALDWLNERTDDRAEFFGLEVELWRIGDSPVAPKFNVVCKPNDWSRTLTRAASQGEVSETKLRQQQFWAHLREILLDSRSPVRPQKPLPQHWTNFAIGRSNFHLIAVQNTQAPRIGVGLVISGPDAKQRYQVLESQRDAIEAEFGQALVWKPLENKKEKRIELFLEGADPTNEDDWARQADWMRGHLEKFHEVFQGRVKNLSAGEAPE